jgi:hypothetical protein
MNLSNFSDTLIRGANNPDCSFYIGTISGISSVGYWLLQIVKWSVIAFLGWYALRIIYKLIWNEMEARRWR